VDNVTAADTITINSVGAVQATALDAGADLTAPTLDINAVTGIGTGGAGWFDVTSASIAADTTNGNIDIDSLATADGYGRHTV